MNKYTSIDKQDNSPFNVYLRDIWTAAGGDPDFLPHLSQTGSGSLPSAFHVSDLANAAIGAASLAVAELISLRAGAVPPVVIDRRLASFWFQTSLRPQGWSMPPQWDAVAGDYETADGWIRLHTNAPHHRDAAMSVLKTAIDRNAVANAVAEWESDPLEAAIVAANGCAASMRTIDEWGDHPQGLAVNSEPLLHRTGFAADARPRRPIPAHRPLEGVRVLDLTRILAGPVATRFLAGFGAEVLRIDPYGWEEPGTVPEVVLGKRCARLDLKSRDGMHVLETLLSEADVFVHGYRPDALARLGLDAARRRAIKPDLIDVSLAAYGWTGPWRVRRGFDSLIQMSTGIADGGMRVLQKDRPTPLPGQAIDHATGYLMASAAIRGLTERQKTGHGSEARASLARTAKLLISGGSQSIDAPRLAAESEADLADAIEQTGWGPAKRLCPPVTIDGAPMAWDLPAPLLGSSPAAWSTVDA
ncbi:acyl-CoA transferase [Rhodopseudomonas sp. BR0M22]|nr:acyl-CoA transferase [Rhodopseudomonas sp. BR0M22]